MLYFVAIIYNFERNYSPKNDFLNLMTLTLDQGYSKPDLLVPVLCPTIP